MWQNPGPPPPLGFDPEYQNTAYAFPSNPAYPPNIPFGRYAHSSRFYPQPPNPAYSPYQYPPTMNLAMSPTGPPGMMMYEAPQTYLYPPGPHTCTPPPFVYPHEYPHSSTCGHHNGHYHRGARPTSGGFKAELVGAMQHAATKKLRKKMKKWHIPFEFDSSDSD